MGIIEKLASSLGMSKGIDLEEYMDTVEMEEVDVLHEPADHYIIPIALEREDDTTVIMEELKKGNIVLLNISRMTKWPKKLQNVITALKTHTKKINGDIARIDNDKVILTPTKIKIVKRIRRK